MSRIQRYRYCLILFAWATVVMFVYPVVAWAAEDATEVVTAVPIQHPILAIMIPTAMTITRILQGDVTWAPTWLMRYRMLLLAGMAIATGVADKLLTGSDVLSAFVVVASTGVPSLVVELFHFMGNGKDAVSDSKQKDSDVKVIRPRWGDDGGFAAVDVLAQLAIGVTVCGIIFAIFVAAGGCAATKPACGVVHIADEACQTFLVQLPDGTSERLAVEDVQSLAKAHRQLRLGAPK